jgi:hypothetical protein
MTCSYQQSASLKSTTCLGFSPSIYLLKCQKLLEIGPETEEEPEQKPDTLRDQLL